MALSPDTLEKYFDDTQKCIIEWKIQKIEILNQDKCLKEVKVFIKNKDNSTNYFKWDILVWECIIDTFNNIFSEENLKVWKNIKYILDENYSPLSYIPENNLEIKTCVWNKVMKNLEKNNYFFYWTFWWLIIFLLIIFIFFKKRKNPA